MRGVGEGVDRRNHLRVEAGLAAGGRGPKMARAGRGLFLGSQVWWGLQQAAVHSLRVFFSCERSGATASPDKKQPNALSALAGLIVAACVERGVDLFLFVLL